MLEYLLTTIYFSLGLPKLEEGVDRFILDELKRVAKTFYLPHLAQVVDNLENEEEFKNINIGTHHKDRMGQRAKALFLGKETFSDIKFTVQGKYLGTGLSQEREGDTDL